MGIDLFTLIAQIINFLILVYLLKRFLYAPIVKSMDEREKGIASRMKQAEETQKKADQEAETYRQKKQELDKQMDDLIDKARDEAADLKKDLIKKGRMEVDNIKAKWQKAIEREKDSFLKDLRRRASEQIYRAIRKVLQDLAEEDMEQHIFEVFIKRLQNIDDERRQIIIDTVRKSDHGILVRSTFELPEGQRKTIDEVIREKFLPDVNIRYETTQDLICGIELRADGRKIAWNIDNYLQSLEENLFRLSEKPVEVSDEEQENKNQND
jgi:F-type H+-transporting ATPase subunit b